MSNRVKALLRRRRALITYTLAVYFIGAAVDLMAPDLSLWRYVLAVTALSVAIAGIATELNRPIE